MFWLQAMEPCLIRWLHVSHGATWWIPHSPSWNGVGSGTLHRSWSCRATSKMYLFVLGQKWTLWNGPDLIPNEVQLERQAISWNLICPWKVLAHDKKRCFSTLNWSHVFGRHSLISVSNKTPFHNFTKLKMYLQNPISWLTSKVRNILVF